MDLGWKTRQDLTFLLIVRLLRILVFHSCCCKGLSRDLFHCPFNFDVTLSYIDLELSCVDSDLHLCTSAGKSILDVVVSEVLTQVHPWVLLMHAISSGDSQLNCVSMPNILSVQTFEALPDTGALLVSLVVACY